ncbi:NAD(P)/FAD-dependent oxidoreductase [Gryllotalpicola ginsengisoli]|uniref:NAD(P)/FAD-dependent oxidoreductase n=1 Tax=Gryllotalpicola ginsengisoli TaxID=444608 RepID=UPI0003B46CAD|nr:FAD-dependent oxidoreductase [Gryllotalpicola ginsengisoli]
MSAARVVVVGSGVAGAATAFGLARRGASVTVVDAGLAGRATAAGAGIIQPWSVRREGEFYELYAAGAAFYPELVSALAEHGVDDIGYKVTGALLVSEDAAELDEAEARLTARQPDAPPMGELRRLTSAQATELFPPLGPRLDAVLIGGGARVDGRMLQAGLLLAAQSLGARVLDDEATLEASDRGLSLVVGEGETLEADAIVVACGAWTNRVLEPTGARVPVEPQKGQITHLRVAADTSAWPVVSPFASHYLLAFDDSRVVVGATRETGSGFDTRITAQGQLEVLHNALSVAPGLAHAAIIETRVGLRPLPVGELPTVGPVATDASGPALFVNAGFGAAGLTMGPLVGDRLAAQVLDGV